MWGVGVALCVSPDGRTILYVDNVHGRLWSMDHNATTILFRPTDKASFGSCAMSRNLSFIYLANNKGEIAAYGPNGGSGSYPNFAVYQAFCLGYCNPSMALSPQEDRLVVANDFVLTFDTTSRSTLSLRNLSISDPRAVAYAPHGQIITSDNANNTRFHLLIV